MKPTYYEEGYRLYAVLDEFKLEQAVAAKPTAEFDAVWGKGFLPPEKFVAMLYANLKKSSSENDRETRRAP
jgi:hypothetical protein